MELWDAATILLAIRWHDKMSVSKERGGCHRKIPWDAAVVRTFGIVSRSRALTGRLVIHSRRGMTGHQTNRSLQSFHQSSRCKLLRDVELISETLHLHFSSYPSFDQLFSFPSTITTPPVNSDPRGSQGSGFLLYAGHGGTTTRNVIRVPPRPDHNVRCIFDVK